MSFFDRSLDLAGFDAQLARGAAARHRARWPLAVLAGLAFASSALIGAAAGYASYLLWSSVLAGIAVGLGFAAGVLNLLRVATAGGGIAPHQERAAVLGWRPSWLPAVVLTLVAACMAQPALVALRGRALEPAIAKYRAERVRAHAELERLWDAAAADTANAAARRSEQARAFHAALAAETFFVQRVLLVWREPVAALQGSAAFIALCLLPLLLARWPLGVRLHHYAIERYRRDRAFVRAVEAHADREFRRVLRAWSAAPLPPTQPLAHDLEVSPTCRPVIDVGIDAAGALR